MNRKARNVGGVAVETGLMLPSKASEHALMQRP